MIEDGIPNTTTEFPNAKSTLSAALNAFKLGMERELSVCFPACVYSYNRSTHKAKVMPLVKMAYFNGDYYYIRRKTFDVTVRSIQCGGMVMEVPLYVGDTGWVVSSDRDTTLLKQTGALTSSVLAGNRSLNIVEDDYQVPPHHALLHQLTDGFFIPDSWGVFEAWRYKDNPQIAIGSALYIGNSFDTKEDREDNGTGGSEKKFQDGDSYEKKSTASFVITNGGVATMASSLPKEDKKRAGVETGGDWIRMHVTNDKDKQVQEFLIDAGSGITLRQDDEDSKSTTVFNMSPGQVACTIVNGESTIQIMVANGEVNLSTSGGMNVTAGDTVNFRAIGDLNIASSGNVNVNTTGDARVTAQGSATVSATENASVTAGGNVNVSSVGDANVSSSANTNVNGGENVNIGAAENVNIASKDKVNIVTAGDTTVMSKKSGANILVTTLSKNSNIDIVAEGKSSNVSVTMKEEESSLSFTTEKKDSPISIETKGENSPVTITTSESSNVGITAGKDSNVDISSEKGNITLYTSGGDLTANVRGNADMTVSESVSVSAKSAELKADEIELTGAVSVYGSLTLNGAGFEKKEHAIDKDNTAKYWAHG